MNSDPKLRRTFVVLTLCTIAVFTGLVFGITAMLRGRLRHEIQQREAQSIHDVAVMEITQGEARLQRLKLPATSADVFAAVLESSRFHGVLSVQLFDPSGRLHEALPAVTAEAAARGVWWPPDLTAPDSRYHPNGHLEQILGLPADVDRDVNRAPLLEVVVPLRRSRGGMSLGIARYWIDGADIRSEFARLDRSLAVQAGLAGAGGALLIALLLTWSYRRLMQMHREVVERSTDLARANQELDFAAKTGALGAISAHLIHGLKNPLAGLEGFVADATAADAPDHGEARRTALETARRIRRLVNDVMSVLRDESSDSAEYPVPLQEVLEATRVRLLANANGAGVQVLIGAPPGATVLARTANLAGLVLANLTANAIEASGGGATVRLEANVAGNQVEILVTDQGPGLPSRVRDELFRPVLSTKRGGGGMGLAISARLARHAGGELSLVRSDATGTVFRLTVPAINDPARSA